MPQRIQRKRTKGWKMPEGVVSVTRPGKWGNPFQVGQWAKIGSNFGGISAHYYLVGWVPPLDPNEPGWQYLETTEQAVAMFRHWMGITKPDVSELQGKDLACWCKSGEPCHADVLLEMANK
jgi:hypothetical protein